MAQALQFANQLQPSAWLLQVIIIIWALSLCLLGYLLFRAQLVVIALHVGAVLGAILVEHYFQKPTGLDYFIACIPLAALMGMLAWYLYRLMLSIQILIMTGLLILHQASQMAEAWHTIIIGFVGLVVAILAFIYLRQIFIVLTAVGGAAIVVLSAMSLILSRPPELLNEQILGGQRQWGVTIAFVVLSIALTVGGVIVQSKVTHLARTRFTPEAGKGESPFVGKKGSKARLPIGKK